MVNHQIFNGSFKPLQIFIQTVTIIHLNGYNYLFKSQPEIYIYKVKMNYFLKKNMELKRHKWKRCNFPNKKW